VFAKKLGRRAYSRHGASVADHGKYIHFHRHIRSILIAVDERYPRGNCWVKIERDERYNYAKNPKLTRIVIDNILLLYTNESTLYSCSVQQRPQ